MREAPVAMAAWGDSQPRLDVLDQSAWLDASITRIAGRIATLLSTVFADAESDPGLAAACRFLSEWPPASTASHAGRGLPRCAAVDRLVCHLSLDASDLDLLLLAGIAEEHEGYADLFRRLHPRGVPRPTVGLAAQVFAEDRPRGELRRRLEIGPLVRTGLVRLEGEAPFFEQTLNIAERLWPVMHGIDVWPQAIIPESLPAARHGLEDWLNTAEASRARGALRANRPCTILVTAVDAEIAFERSAALVATSGREAVHVRVPRTAAEGYENLLSVHAVARDVVPVLRLPSGDGSQSVDGPAFTVLPGPAVIAGREGLVNAGGTRPVVHLDCPRLRPAALARMWAGFLPALADQAPLLAARYPVEPACARQVAHDLEAFQVTEPRPPSLSDVAASVRSRAGPSLSGAIRQKRPCAGWNALVVADEAGAQLREAVARLLLQERVFDQWRFLENRPGARGVRMLFAGTPGTGKTLAAEVVAKALEVDLMVVDVSRVVSKWLGETEKNLADVFDAAERTRAVLLFDEADALFGKRTEVSDAHDRYANLETAYLLARLERYEGLTILSTNLKQNIDQAFLRRLEFLVDFQEPSREQRLALWQRHLPPNAPLAGDVDLAELAAHYAIVGGLIRNAAVAAAFLAADDGLVIRRDHFIRAIRREYVKSGKAFVGVPATRKPS